MNYEISFKTIQKYCMHKRLNNINPRYIKPRFKYRCNKAKLVWPDNWDIDKDNRCAEANCPLVKRLWAIRPYIPVGGVNI